MTAYARLDAIADSVNWLLLAAFLAGLAVDLGRRRWRNAGSGLVALAGVVVIVYGLAFLDQRLGLWPRIGADYSTHSAAAAALVILLMARFPRPRWFWPGIGLAYALLMLWQRYHTVLDIVSTALVAGLLAWGWRRVSGFIPPVRRGAAGS
ncbi:hypothetical protein EBB59_11385 [Lysobacter pythonis]|uniref:Phosphatase PAP2 family protein n=1 Tax=Solilutibacter pythonis TaxID=2483112 RepID=A0A3M2HG18_9GAMM|nr:hypothetical protein [Lysobacter pythonis]RMH88676.1 hypothetical protein EBB59_11385 [Lysobacter pythonis]